MVPVSLSLFKTKSRALHYTVHTLKHYWHCITFIYEERVTKGHSIKKNQGHLIHSKPLKFSFFFLPQQLTTFSQCREKKVGENFAESCWYGSDHISHG